MERAGPLSRPAIAHSGQHRTSPFASGPGLRLLSIVAIFLAWEIAARAAGSRMLPPASSVLAEMARLTASGQLPLDMAITLARVAAAFALAMALGTALGIAMGLSRRLDALLDAPVLALLNLPALVVIVLLYIWFGLTETSAVLAVALNKLPSTAVTLREGARSLDPALSEMARSFRYSRAERLRHVVLPQLTPYLLAAARTGLALIWKVVLVAELLGRSSGVGFRIQVLFQLFDITGILAYTLAFLLVVQAIEWVLLQPWERRANRWRRQSGERA